MCSAEGSCNWITILRIPLGGLSYLRYVRYPRSLFLHWRSNEMNGSRRTWLGIPYDLKVKTTIILGSCGCSSSCWWQRSWTVSHRTSQSLCWLLLRRCQRRRKNRSSSRGNSRCQMRGRSCTGRSRTRSRGSSDTNSSSENWWSRRRKCRRRRKNSVGKKTNRRRIRSCQGRCCFLTLHRTRSIQGTLMLLRCRERGSLCRVKKQSAISIDR